MTAQPRMSEEEGRLVFVLATALSTILDILDPVKDAAGRTDGDFVSWSVDHTFAKCPEQIVAVAKQGHEEAKIGWQQSMRQR